MSNFEAIRAENRKLAPLFGWRELLQAGWITPEEASLIRRGLKRRADARRMEEKYKQIRAWRETATREREARIEGMTAKAANNTPLSDGEADPSWKGVARLLYRVLPTPQVRDYCIHGLGFDPRPVGERIVARLSSYYPERRGEFEGMTLPQLKGELKRHVEGLGIPQKERSKLLRSILKVRDED